MKRILSALLILTFIVGMSGCHRKKDKRLIVDSKNIAVEIVDSSSESSGSKTISSSTNSVVAFNDGKWDIIKPSKYWKDGNYEVKIPTGWDFAGDYHFTGTNKWWDEYDKEYTYSTDFYSKVYWHNKDKKDVLLVVSEYLGDHPFPDGADPIGSTTKENMESIQGFIMDRTAQKFIAERTHSYIVTTKDAKKTVGQYDTSSTGLQFLSPYADGKYRYSKGYTVFLPNNHAVMFSFYDNTTDHSMLENINKTIDEMLELMIVK